MIPRLLTKRQAKTIRFRNGCLQDSTLETYQAVVRRYFAFLVATGNEKKAENIDVIKAFLSQYDNANSYNQALVALREFYYKQIENRPPTHRLIMREKLESIKRMKPARNKNMKMKYLKESEISRLVECCTERTGCFIEILFWTGARVSELTGIKLKDIIFSDSPGTPMLVRTIGKGMKEDWMFLPEHVYKKARRVFAGKVYLIETKKGRRFNRCYVSNDIRRQALLKLGLKGITAHTMRHSKAMYLKARGMSPDQIAKALRQSDVKVTLQYYFHDAPTAKEQGM